MLFISTRTSKLKIRHMASTEVHQLEAVLALPTLGLGHGCVFGKRQLGEVQYARGCA